jgi:hypothetical protein
MSLLNGSQQGSHGSIVGEPSKAAHWDDEASDVHYIPYQTARASLTKKGREMEKMKADHIKIIAKLQKYYRDAVVAIREKDASLVKAVKG